ncbi:MAG: hypothetical protein HYU39_08680 [Thaumarchaeota archaeon]|nr:hypothetical protein [Nitrososphaerota archaeon]
MDKADYAALYFIPNLSNLLRRLAFRIAQQVSEHKGTSDVRPMFREAKERVEAQGSNQRWSVQLPRGQYEGILDSIQGTIGQST